MEALRVEELYETLEGEIFSVNITNGDSVVILCFLYCLLIRVKCGIENKTS